VRPILLLTPGTATPFAEGAVRLGRLEVATALRREGGGLRLDWSVRIPGRTAMPVGRIGLAVDAGPDRSGFDAVLEHGWQSWSVVRRCPPADVRPERRRLPSWRRARDFTDAEVAGRAVVGEPFLLTDRGIAGFLSARTHLGRVEASPAGDRLLVWALLDGVVLAPGEERRLEPVWLADGRPGPLYSEYAGLAATEVNPAAPPAGWCSWYHHYAAVTPDDIRRTVPAAAAAGLEFVQIDDGDQAAIGEWLTPRPSWAEGTRSVAADIRAAGLRAGLWTAPFLADERGRLVAEHPDWVLTGRAGRPRRAMHNPRWWGGWAVALDTSNPAVLDHLRRTFAALSADGFDYHKIDFLTAGALPGRRHQPATTRAEAFRAALEAIRDGIGADAFLLGCGSPLLPAVGLVDAMRVSPDVAPWWSPLRPRPGLAEAASCARNAILTSALRAPLHRRWWINDVDCLLLRPVDTALQPWQRRAVAASVAASGFVVVSDDLSTYRTEEWGRLAAVLDTGRAAAGPSDLIDPFAPVLTVRSPSTTLEIDVAALTDATAGDAVSGAGVLIDGGPVILRRRR
jgi:alpha-galactosidase